jgi:hypothetical protein
MRRRDLFLLPFAALGLAREARSRLVSVGGKTFEGTTSINLRNLQPGDIRVAFGPFEIQDPRALAEDLAASIRARLSVAIGELPSLCPPSA